MGLEISEDMPSWEWAEGIDEEVVEVLKDEQADDEDRLLAARIAGDYTVINDELAEAPLAVVQDSEESEKLRGRALIYPLLPSQGPDT